MYKKSIVSIFVAFGITAIMLFLLTYLFIFSILKEQNNAQEDFIYKVSSANNLIVGIEQCRASIWQYRHDWDSTYWDSYQENIEKLNKDATQYLSDTSNFSLENIQSVRRLQNFLSYQNGLINTPPPSNLKT